MDPNPVAGAHSTAQNFKESQCSDAQQGLYFRCQIDPKNPVYNISCSYKLYGVIDLEAFSKSLGLIVNRHEVLRTRFQLRSTGLVQLIAPPVNHDESTIASEGAHLCKYLNVRVLPTSISASELSTTLNDEINDPFELNGGELFRSILFSDPTGQSHVFVFVVHHLIFDHSSKSIFNYELSQLYNHLAHNRLMDLEPLAYQFSDYIQLKEQKLQNAVSRKQINYWQKKLDDVEQVEIPVDRPRSALPSSKGIRIEQALSDELVDAVKAVANEHHSTLFITTLALAKVLISRWTGGNDIALGTHYADRRYLGGDSMLGFLLNTLVLRSDLSNCETFADLLNSVQKTCFQAYRYSDIPFEKVVESLLVDRNYERNPFFDVRFTHLKDHEHQLDLEGLSVDTIELEECRARYDLTFTLLERQGRYLMQLEYRPDLFDRTKVEWLLKKYVSLLGTVSTNAQIPLKELTLVDAEIEHELLSLFNQTATPFPKEKAIHHLISEQVNRTPKAVALRYLHHKKTYEELENDTNQLANYLVSLGVTYGTVVAVCVDRSIDMVVALLSVLKAGATYLPIDRNFPVDRIQHMVSDSGCEYIITTSLYAETLPDNAACLIQLDADQEKIAQNSHSHSHSHSTSESDLAGTQPWSSRLNEGTLAYLIYTSGSTGKPKGVRVTHENVVNFLNSMGKTPGLGAGDVLMAVTTLSFDIAVLEIWLPLISGATTVIAPSDVVSDGAKLNALIDQEHVTVMQATPISWRLLLAAGWNGGQHFKALCGGEAMPPDLAIELHQKVGELWNMYGPTETTVWSSCCKIDNPSEPIHIGSPIDNTTFYILNDDRQLVMPGAAGELYIGGAGVTSGYHNRPGLTSEKFIDSPFDTEERLYATGDAARLTSSGNIEFIARKDNQVKVRGLRIELGEIESQLNANASVIQSAVVVREDKPGDQRIVAYFESHNPGPALVTELRNSLRSALPNYMVPQQWVCLDQLPLTPNGKLDRNSLLTIAPIGSTDASSESTVGSAYPVTVLEKRMAEIWSDVLGFEKVPVDTAFFDLGGHSLLAMRVIARAREELDIVINPMSMVSDSIRDLVRASDPESETIDSPTVHKERRRFETFFFSENQLYGRLDIPSSNQAVKGAVLLCNPIYIESANIHWGYRRLAALLCAAGFYVLRFDYYGTGNSLGEDDEGCVNRWSEDIANAAAELLMRSEQGSLSVVGFRYGATLGSLLDGVSIDTFVLWEPVMDSHAHVTSLKNKYNESVIELNEYAAQQRTVQVNELSGYEFSDKAEKSIVENELHVDALVKRCKHVVLVSNEVAEKYHSYADIVDIVSVDDTLPSMETMVEPSIWLPGKSLFEILQCLKSDSHE